MAARRSAATRQKSPRIAINGRFLDEVGTRLEYGYKTQSIAIRRLPEKHHHLIADGDGVTLRCPAITALQLYFDGVLPADRDEPVELSVAGKSLGSFAIEWLRRVDGDEFGEPILLRFRRADR